MDWLVLAVALVAIPAASLAVWRQPVVALYAFVVGLAAHNAVFMLLFAAGAEGWQLTVAQAWKEVLLGVALARVVRDGVRSREMPFRPGAVDVLALAFLAVAVVYALLPQGVLDGGAGPKAELYALRHELLPLAAFVVGRATVITREQLARLVRVILAAAAAVAAVGIVEAYAVPLSAWRSLGAASYFADQLDFGAATGPGGLPENWVLNTSDGVFRRAVSTFLSPLGSAYMLVVALLLAAATRPWRNRRIWGALALVAFAGLLFTFTRSAVLALAGGLVVLAVAQRRSAPLAAAAAVVAIGIGFAAAFPSIAPGTAFFPEDLAKQAEIAAEKGDVPEGNPAETTFDLSDPSSQSHLDELDRGWESFTGHLEGYGPGNSGQTAQRFGVESRAGESVYLELAADLGVVGAGLWLAFCAVVLVTLLRRARSVEDKLGRELAAGVCAAAAALFAIGVLSDVWGNPWSTIVLWWLAGAAITERRPEPPRVLSSEPGRERELVNV